jgi:hypothetical protein
MNDGLTTIIKLEREPIKSRDRTQYAPNHHLNEMPLICEVSKLMYQLGLHVVKYDNTNRKCQSV